MSHLLGPEFHVPFHLVKNQVEVFRCEAHISLLGMVISSWAATSMFESSWGGDSKICLALRKRRDCALASHILALPVFHSMFYFFSPLSLLLSTSFSLPFFFFHFLSHLLLVLLPPSLLSFSLFLSSFPSFTLLSSVAYLPLSPSSLPSFLSLSFFLFTFMKKQKNKNKDLVSMEK